MPDRLGLCGTLLLIDQKPRKWKDDDMRYVAAGTAPFRKTLGGVGLAGAFALFVLVAFVAAVLSATLDLARR